MVIDRLGDMRLFIDAAELGSFSAAGRKQGLSPAAASACIQRMEEALGTRLFERTTRQLRLTEEGQTYRHYCQQAVGLLEEAELHLQAGRQHVQGTVRLSAPSDLGRNLLLDYLDAFRRCHPDVRFSLHLSDSMSNLVGDDIDLAIRYGQPADSSMVARKLAANTRVVCASPALLARTGRPAHPDELQQHPCLVLTTMAGPMNEWRYREEGRPHSVRLQHYQESNDGEVIRRLALQGQGFACKSRLDIAADLQAGRLETVLDEYFTESTPLNVLFHGSRFQPPRVRLLIDFLQQQFAAL